MLQSHSGGKKLLQTFGGDLEGPVEALSQGAAASLASGMASCTQGQGYLKQPENQWLSHCASAPFISIMMIIRIMKHNKTTKTNCSNNKDLSAVGLGVGTLGVEAERAPLLLSSHHKEA